MKALVQSDFDGTITEEDVSSFLLEDFAQGDWRRLLREYREGRISVADLNIGAFSMIHADKATLLGALKGRVRVRPGFSELVDYCLNNGVRFVIVSNGLDFYIDAVLKDMGLETIEVHSARAHFHPEGMRVHYIGPDGNLLEDGFKEAYTRSFLRQEYRVTYMGNGNSDTVPAGYAHHVFATGELLAHCRENSMNCDPLESFSGVVRALKQILQLQI